MTKADRLEVLEMKPDDAEAPPQAECCSPDEQTTCCEPEDKPKCCGAAAAGGTCGCR
jgi:hypothetical protein